MGPVAIPRLPMYIDNGRCELDSGKVMKGTRAFPFDRARRVTAAERRVFRKAYQNTFGEKPPRRGRPPKGADKYRDVHIKLHPKALEWARARAKQSGIGYQTVINDLLLREAAAGRYGAGRGKTAPA